jgi:adenylate cyclase
LTLAPQPDGPPRVLELVPPTEQLAAAAAGIGHLNITVGADRGVVRSLPLYALDDRDIARPSVVLAAVALAEGASGPLTERPDGVQVGSRLIPLDDGELRINWTDELAADDVIPAIDVLSGDVDSARFRDRIVVVGVTEPTLGDQHLVPLDRSEGTSGVTVIANAVNTIVSNGYLEPASQTSDVLVIIVVTLAVTALFVRVRLLLAALGALAVLAALVLHVSWRIAHDGTLWNLVWPALAVLMAAAAGTAWRYVAEIRHRRRAWRTFATYVPASVVRQLEDPDRLAAALEGARLEITVLFCDLRGFTPIAATLTPAQVRRLLDHYYEYAVGIVHEHGGTVMQFVGDEVFAVFGAPLPTPDSATEAVRAALALTRDVARLDATLQADDLPAIRFGIGLNRGEVVAAHVGTSDRRQYSVMGDTVNVGSRLCSQAGAGEVVSSEAARAAADDDATATLAPAGTVTLKGVAEPVAIFRSTVDVIEPAERAGPSVDAVAASEPSD